MTSRRRAGKGAVAPAAPGRPDGGGSRARRTLLIVGVVVAVQVLLTGLSFDPSAHTGGDNAGYLSLAHSLADRGTYQELWDPAEPPHTKYPPLFPALLAGLMLLGAKSWLTFKLTAAVATTLAVAAAVLWIREVRGVGLALGVGLLLAMSNAWLYYSRWILSDPPFLFLTLASLWTLQRSTTRGGRWLAVGGALAILAYFTRSAGLPLVVAVALWLAWRRRGRALAAFAAAFAVPAVLWWLRGRGARGGGYVSEFWLVDPYRPDLGRAGAVDLLLRMGTNLRRYVVEILPEGLTGVLTGAVAVLGVALVLAALWGWVRRLRREPGVAELFFPLYGGLLLLWPVPWSGDRFALPLFPLLLLYGAEGLEDLLGRIHRKAVLPGLAAAFLVLALPALGSWSRDVQRATLCRAPVTEGDPFFCYGAGVREYVALARWSGRYLPEDAVVVTRKPRIFYVLSGRKAVSLPLTRDPDAFLGRLREAGAGYLTFDRVDGLASYYLPPVLQARSGAFCAVTGVGRAGQPRTELLGLREEPAGVPEEASPEGGLRIEPCPASFVRRPAPGEEAPPLTDVPLLRR